MEHWRKTQPIRRTALVAIVSALVLVVPAVPAVGQDWSLRLAPYAWGVSLQGQRTAELAGPQGGIDEGGDRLALAAGVSIEVARGRGRILADGSVLHGLGRTTEGGSSGAAEAGGMVWRMGELLAAYRLSGAEPSGWFELFGGARHTSLMSRSSGGALGAKDGSSTTRRWTDPVIGGRFLVPMRHWFGLIMRVDVGGFGIGSEFTWSFSSGYLFRIGHVLDLSVEYHLIDLDYVAGEPDGEDYFVYDQTAHGLLTRLAVSF